MSGYRNKAGGFDPFPGEVGFIDDIDHLVFMAAEFRKYGFDPFLIASVNDAKPGAIKELSLQLMEKIVEARSLSKRGKTHLVRQGMAVPDKLIDWLITFMLEALSSKDQRLFPRDLVELVRERLGGCTEYQKAANAGYGRSSAINIGGRLLAKGIRPSFGMIAKELKVAPSTVKRWFPENDFVQQVERNAKELYDENGDRRPLPPIPPVPPALRRK